MPRQSNHFQRLVALLNSCLAGGARVTESALLTDKITGELREVDVFIESETAGYKVNISIEVVARGRKADSPWVESMHSKHSSLSTDKLILVAEKGFTKPALQKAKFYGVEAISVEEALASDWALATQLTTTGFFEITDFKYKCAIVYQAPDGSAQLTDVESNSSITRESGEVVTFNQFVRHVLDLPEIKAAIYPQLKKSAERNFWFSYTKPGTTWEAVLDGKCIQITEVRVALEVAHAKTPVQFASGKFRQTPFVSGTSTSEEQPLQFVLVKGESGMTEGMIVGATGLRRLLSRQDISSKAPSI